MGTMTEAGRADLTVNHAGLLNAGPSAFGWSQQEDILICPWRFAARRLRMMRRGLPSDPLIRGALFHIGAAHYWTGRLPDGQRVDCLSPVDAVHELARQEDLALREAGYTTGWGVHVPLIAAAVREYQKNNPYLHLGCVAVEWQTRLWIDEATPGTARVVEPPADADLRMDLLRVSGTADTVAERADAFLRLLRLRGPYVSTFRADLVAQMPDGRIMVVDHKTTGRLDQRKRDGFVVSGQMAQYALWGRLALGAQLAGVAVAVVNLTTAATLPGATAVSGAPTTKKVDPLFSSFPVPVREATIAAFPQRVYDGWNMLRWLLIEQGRSLDSLPRALREQGPCSDRYGTCELHNACVGET